MNFHSVVVGHGQGFLVGVIGSVDVISLIVLR